ILEQFTPLIEAIANIWRGLAIQAKSFHVIASEAKQSSSVHGAGLLRRFAPRNDGVIILSPD
ncbi:hypothetical protein, partial [Rhodopseudomonas sp. B29]|uniref:hypothetical protein n=1 Tax=Rhodopseudomonas sp. B29 TaxID=95607 RepID=UPI001AEBE799